MGSVSKLLLARFDTQLQPLSGASLLKNDFSLGSTLGGAKVLAAFDGTHVLALWTEGKSGGTTRLVAQSFLPDGGSVGAARTVGDAALAANDSRPALMAMKGGGFLVAWRQQVSSGAGDTGAVSLRVAALDSFGRGAFNNVACGESDFQLATAGGGDLGQPALSVAPDGRVLVAYTNRRAESSLSLNDISLVSLEPSRLFPSGVLRPPAPAPRTIGAPPQTIGGPHPSCQGTLAGKAGRACTCDEKCEDPGAICRAEELSGRAGGFCHLECNPNLSGSCPAGSMCKAQSSIALGGLCQRACTRDADCGVGRVCLPETGSCMYVCASPSDCRSGTCDPYSGACAGLNANPDAGGLLAPCVDDLDCRSLSCTPADHALYPKRCETLCRADRPACPENGVCVPLSGNLGICLPPCSSKQTCKAGSGLLCFELSSIDVPVCLPP